MYDVNIAEILFYLFITLDTVLVSFQDDELQYIVNDTKLSSKKSTI